MEQVKPADPIDEQATALVPCQGKYILTTAAAAHQLRRIRQGTDRRRIEMRSACAADGLGNASSQVDHPSLVNPCRAILCVPGHRQADVGRARLNESPPSLTVHPT